MPLRPGVRVSRCATAMLRCCVACALALSASTVYAGNGAGADTGPAAPREAGKQPSAGSAAAGAGGMASMELTGRWIKTTPAACAARYPDRLRFSDNGVYGASGGSMVYWDAGLAELRGTDRVMIPIANGAEIEYAWRIADGVLTFTDPDGCAFSYRRAADGD